MLKVINLNYDYVFIEGFHSLLGRESWIYKVIITKNRDDLKELMEIIDKNQLIAIFLNGIRKNDIIDIINNELILDLSAEDITRFKDLIEKI